MDSVISKSGRIFTESIKKKVREKSGRKGKRNRDGKVKFYMREF